MILLDTNALIFLVRGHKRAAPLRKHAKKLAMSPVSLLELKFLEEVGRVRLPVAGTHSAKDDPRWAYDDIALEQLVEHALDHTFTRDPFDRLLAAHCTARRWKLATTDATLIENLPPRFVFEL